MAMPVRPYLVGVDVSKAELAICEHPEAPVILLENDPGSIAGWLKQLQAPACLAVEATNTYHMELVDQAHRLGHTVYVVDGFRLNRYRQSIGGRAKTDSSDARLLWRYLDRERADLRPWTPPSKGYRTLQQLLRRRAVLVRAKSALEQSLREVPELKREAQGLTKQFKMLDSAILRRIRECIRHHQWQADMERCQGIEGVGPLSAAALTMAFQRGHFRSNDAFVAFLGLDVRVRDSGKTRGQRKLTKQGDPELRRLLYLAAMTASRSATWRGFYQRHLDRGLSPTQAFIILARKIARIAFSLLKNQTTYQPKPHIEACAVT
ncbi:IS110 family RNA-guided transposase [Thiohalomonas denitrificans]|uniref:Transposase n=1 Tax=Thiohalomonas denitrificans TaxID=415747 RepID=A0A1G5PN07_9GAMM|nr:IS110 family transposase [Thiohalomonas denitrificans]SCZ50847.1 Transposase [Thiohalomonas denitrificans]SCZ66116.1 Transposase [Thiohalomonas denitrificans]SCZ67202.1 Transposase [Thiohalomonas denitrificans]SCZ67493.1 Transposase [Thiohalomonas denitrificans]